MQDNLHQDTRSVLALLGSLPYDSDDCRAESGRNYSQPRGRALVLYRRALFGLPVRESERELPSVFQEEEALLVVRLHLAQQKAEEALQELASWKEQAQAQGRLHAVLEMLILQALAHFAARSLPPARSTLLQALKLAQPENCQRLFGLSVRT